MTEILHEWAQPWLLLLLGGAIGYCIGSLRDAHDKLDKVLRRQDRLMEMHIALLKRNGLDPVTLD